MSSSIIDKVLKRLNLQIIPKNDDEKFNNDNNEKNDGNAFVNLLIALVILGGTIFALIIHTECIVYNGENPDGSINWLYIIMQVILYTFCCPCFLIYYTINRCKSKKTQQTQLF